VLPEGLVSSSRHICYHRAPCTVCIIRQEYSERPDNLDLRYLPLPATAALMVVHQNSVCASLHPLDVVRLPVILRMPNPGVADSLLTVSLSIVKCYLDLA
jgi:hypothetical protein